MHPYLLKLVSSEFYGGKLSTDISEAMRNIVTSRLNMPHNCPIAWFDTGLYLISNLLEAKCKPSQIGVVCGLVTCKIFRLISICSIFKKEIVTCNTVDGFQGSEKDIIIVCTLKTARNAYDVCSGFSGDPKRINVAISRARCGLFIYGDIKFLERNAGWRSVIDFFKRLRAVDYPYNMKNLFKKR
uniref:AAA_12 domain-containing protein n=1 Tax=Strongyloides papillosus TaxID=174720 RepID=A0A0N5C987_STREA